MSRRADLHQRTPIPVIDREVATLGEFGRGLGGHAERLKDADNLVVNVRGPWIRHDQPVPVHRRDPHAQSDQQNRQRQTRGPAAEDNHISILDIGRGALGHGCLGSFRSVAGGQSDAVDCWQSGVTHGRVGLEEGRRPINRCW